MNKLKVTYKKSYISTPKKHRAVIKSLGFKKLNQTKIIKDNPCTRGMINKVNYLLQVEKV